MVIAITPSPLHPIQREIEKTVETVEGINRPSRCGQESPAHRERPAL